MSEADEMLKRACKVLVELMPLVAKDVKARKPKIDGFTIGEINDILLYGERHYDNV